MPINAGVEYFKAKDKYEKATTLHEKLLALQEMRSAAPKHKGAENLRAEIALKIAKLKREGEKQAKQAKLTFFLISRPFPIAFLPNIKHGA